MVSTELLCHSNEHIQKWGGGEGTESCCHTYGLLATLIIHSLSAMVSNSMYGIWIQPETLFEKTAEASQKKTC